MPATKWTRPPQVLTVNKMKKLAICIALALGAFGCGDDDGNGSGTDAGTGITLPDSGMVGTDAGTGTGTDAGTGTGTDAGMARQCAQPQPDLRELAAMNPGANVLPRCAAATAMCLQGCMDQACQTACLEADMTPPLTAGSNMIGCDGCLNIQSLGCASNEGCGDEVAAAICCFEDNPSNGQTACASQIDAYRTCAQGLGNACAPYISACFPAAGG